MFNKVRFVAPLSDYMLLVSFVDDTQKKYDVKPWFERKEVFQTLSQVKGLFELVQVDVGGYGVSWNDDIDLSCNELYANGKSTKT